MDPWTFEYLGEKLVSAGGNQINVIRIIEIITESLIKLYGGIQINQPRRTTCVDVPYAHRRLGRKVLFI